VWQYFKKNSFFYETILFIEDFDYLKIIFSNKKSVPLPFNENECFNRRNEAEVHTQVKKIWLRKKLRGFGDNGRISVFFPILSLHYLKNGNIFKGLKKSIVTVPEKRINRYLKAFLDAVQVFVVWLNIVSITPSIFTTSYLYLVSARRPPCRYASNLSLIVHWPATMSTWMVSNGIFVTLRKMCRALHGCDRKSTYNFSTMVG